MGRRRLGQNKDKRVISISLDRELVYRFDKTLGDYTRSGRMEKLIVEYLKTTQTKLAEYARHVYHCNSCHREWHQNRYLDTILMVCSGDTGCGSGDVLYCGILGEEE